MYLVAFFLGGLFIWIGLNFLLRPEYILKIFKQIHVNTPFLQKEKDWKVRKPFTIFFGLSFLMFGLWMIIDNLP